MANLICATSVAPGPATGIGQLFDGCIHLLLKEGCLGVLHSGSDCFNWLHLGLLAFVSLVNDSDLVLKFFL